MEGLSILPGGRGEENPSYYAFWEHNKGPLESCEFSNNSFSSIATGWAVPQIWVTLNPSLSIFLSEKKENVAKKSFLSPCRRGPACR